ncbi:MAG: sialidase family protein [Candidatus Brocadiia bacterium]|nr:sialidase family protein [Candidatus Brocadiia bacterium]
MNSEERHECYTDDWKRTEPDLVLYLPPKPAGPDGDNEHIIINFMPKSGDMLATWTTGTYESAPNSRTVFSRSADGGVTWSEPKVMLGTDDDQVLCGRWGFHIVSRAGRVYFFSNRYTGISDFSFSANGVMRCVYSDDDGHTWQPGCDIPVRWREKYDHPDRSVPRSWIVWQPAIRDPKGRWITGFTRWSSLQKFAYPKEGHHPDSRSELMRFDNIDEGPDPKDLKITWLPEGDSISVPCPVEPEKSRGYSLGEEPSIVVLPDGRLFLIMRTRTGHIWYTVSEDEGASWRATDILRRRDGGPEMLHPKSPCPIYRLEDGRYVLFFHNHDGTGYGAAGPHDMNARRPIFMSVGEFRPGAEQPLWFSEPKLLFDTHGVAVGPGGGGVIGGRIWLAMYGSFTERDGRRIVWYPDRKHFLLGKLITDELLADMTVPQA